MEKFLKIKVIVSGFWSILNIEINTFMNQVFWAKLPNFRWWGCLRRWLISKRCYFSSDFCRE